MVNFENGKTPINDTNLNKMQTDLQAEIDKLKGIKLYSDETGVTGTGKITFSQSISKFKRIKLTCDICEVSGDKYAYGVVKEVDVTGTLTNLLISEPTKNIQYLTFNISGTELTITRNRQSVNGTTIDGDFIYIREVIGYTEV